MFHKNHLMGFILVLLVFSTSWWSYVACADYKSALIKSFWVSEDQPAGKLPPDERFHWRGNSTLNDGAAGKHIDVDHPGSDLATDTAVALAAVSIVFQQSDAQYVDTVLANAIHLLKFACVHQGNYSDNIPIMNTFYSDTGLQDELLLAAAWLYKATNDKTYLDCFGATRDSGGEKSMLSWDDKFAVLDGTVPNTTADHLLSFRGQFLGNQMA